MQVIAATFNASSGSQTFGITTGTSNCADGKTSAAVMKQQDFIANNLAPLSKEMAQGNGDTLTAFTETLGCDASIGSAVKENLQKSHVKIFSSPGAIAVLESAKAELRSHPSIAQGCSWI